MTTKLVSANLGLILVVEKNGKQQKKQFSIMCPCGVNQPTVMVAHLCDFLNEQLNMDIFVDWHDISKSVVKIARPAKIKAPRKMTQSQFNRKIKELAP